MTDEQTKELAYRILGWALRHPFWGAVLAFGAIAYFFGVLYLFSLVGQKQAVACPTDRPILMLSTLSLTEAGKVECSTDGKTWFYARSDGTCHLEDTPDGPKWESKP
jgi:hypothetical protein